MHLQELFSIRLIQAKKSCRDIINIDKSWFNKNTRAGYSWINKGKCWYITNMKFENNAFLIKSIWVNGFATNIILYSIVNSINFLEFLNKLP